MQNYMPDFFPLCHSHLLRHRSTTSGEAGAAAAYICGPQLHQQVNVIIKAI